MCTEREDEDPDPGPDELDEDGARSLDLAVALRADGYGWVQWKHRALAGAALDEPGRFIAAPGTPVAHLQEPAADNVPLAAAPFRHLKPYSSDPGLALAVAERVGLFGAGGAELSRRPAGPWRLVAQHGLDLEDGRVARLVSRAILAYLDAVYTERGS